MLARSDALPPGRRDVAHALLDYATAGLIALDAEHRVLVVNEAACRILGCGRPRDGEATEVLLASAPALQGGSGQEALFACFRGASGPAARVALADGRTLIVERTVAPDGHILLALTVALPVQAPLERTDALTGLADRSWFHERLAALTAAPGAGIALLMIDLDRFKHVNDSLGHPAGDALLRLVARRLRATVREADVVSRLGGDEFAVAMPAGPDVETVAARLVTALSRPYLVERRSAVIGASVGIALAPQHGADPVGLVRAADLALYQAKASGRGTVCVFDDEMDRRARQQHALAEDLRRAIPLQQLCLHFQPQLCLKTRRLVGFEALVRWRHPERGLVSPDAFIPLAEEMGLILPIGEWVLREACRQAMSWPGEISVAVNVSPKQLNDPARLPRAIAFALSSSGLPSERLEIEITESALVRESEALEVLTAVRELGVRVSMDDFGTGYSSLSQLRRFPFDKLKIDRSFVRDLGHSEEAGAVVRAIAALGRSLGMVTIAEGVETEHQAAMIRADGCAEMQGYLVSRPIPGNEVAALIQTLS